MDQNQSDSPIRQTLRRKPLNSMQFIGSIQAQSLVPQGEKATNKRQCKACAQNYPQAMGSAVRAQADAHAPFA
jgi:hypothetical protein